MKKAIMSVLTVWILVNMGLFSLILLIPEIEVQVSAATIIVDDDGTPGVDCNYTTIQQGINAASPGDTVFVKNGTYYENVDVYKTINLTGENKNTTIIDGGGGRVIFVNDDWVNINGFTLTNSGFGVNDAGILILYSSNANITNNNFINCGIALSSNILSDFNAHTISTDNRINGKSVYYYKNTNGIDIDGVPIGQLIIANCSNLNAQNLNISKTDISITIAFSSVVTITRNNISNNGYGIRIVQSSNINVSENKILDINNECINFMYSDNCIVRENDLSSIWTGITLSMSLGVNITNNNFSNNGIYLFGNQITHYNTHEISSNNLVNDKPIYYYKNSTQVNIDDIPTGQIIIANCTDINIKNLNLNNTAVGILGAFSSNITIIENNISNNRYGIKFHSTSNCNITKIILSNNLYGLFLDKSPNNNITSNHFWNNQWGIYLFSNSDDNIIYHNNIIDNIEQVVIFACNANFWNNSVGEGNHWSDYYGIDNGSSGRVAGDGIGDTEIPHPFTNQGSGYNKLDNYPLMNPVGNNIFLYKGWNLISIPLIQLDSNMDFILSSINGYYDAVQWFNASDSSDPWKHNQISKPSHLNDLTEIEYKIGFWIHITEPGGVLFAYQGTQPTSNQSIPLHPGWNMVGYPSLTNRNRTAALNNLTFGSEVDAVWTFNAANKNWEEIKAGDYFEVGRGYWIHATQECEWEVGV